MNQGLTYEIAAVMPQAVQLGIFVSLCTIQQKSATPNADGTPSSVFTNISGLVSIPCMDAPPSALRIQATELRDVAEIMAKGMRHVLLNQCFTDALNWAGRGYQAIVDGVVYALLGAENDSQETQTRLDLQLATV